MIDPATILSAYQARQKAFDAARAELDEACLKLLPRYAAALFREHPGLNAFALAAYQDYDSSQLTGGPYVSQHLLDDDAWTRAGFEGECPVNALDPDAIARIEGTLQEAFWPALQRKHGIGWCIAFWRDATAEPDGYRTEQREHPGFD